MRRPLPPLSVRALALAAALLLAAPPAAAEHSIPFAATGYRGRDLADFPVLVRLAEGSPAGFSYADCAADGSDIRFFDRDGGAIPFEIDTWNPQGESCVWVKMPVLRNLASFTMRYGGSPAAANVPSATWSAYGGVWHMGGASGTVANAAPSGSAYDAAPAGDTTASAAYAGADAPVGVARTTATSAAKGYLHVAGDLNDLGLGDSFTMSGWIRMDGCSGYPRLFSTKTYYTDRNGWEIEMNNGSAQSFTARAGNNDVLNGSFPKSLQGNWVHVAFCYAGSTLTVYGNGARVASGTVTATIENDRGLAFGCNPPGDNTVWVRGAYDECRLMRGAASADWIAADYASQTGTLLAPGVTGDFIEVVSSPAGMSGLAPGAGFHPAAPGATYTFTAPASSTDEAGAVTGACEGWRLYRYGETTPLRTSGDEGGSPLSCTIEYGEAVTLEWVYGSLVYHGWLYDATAGTIAERDAAGQPWVLGVSAASGDLTVTGVRQSGSSGLLNLRLPVTDAAGNGFPVVAIGASAFKANDVLAEVHLPDTLGQIGDFAFQNCAHLAAVRLSNTLRTIGDASFGGCLRLRSVEPFLPDTLTTVKVNAFNGDLRLASPLRVGFGGAPGALTLGYYAFRDCAALPSAEVGPAVTALNPGTFWNCSSLAEVALHDGITSIGQDCFSNCGALRRVTPSPTPAALVSLGQSAYRLCTRLVGEVVLGTNGVDCALASGGSQFYECANITRIVLGPGVSGKIPEFFAYHATAVGELTISSRVTDIARYAFESCPNIPAVVLPDGLASIGNNAFGWCTSLESVTPLLPAGVAGVPASAFRGCTALVGELSVAPGGAAGTIGEYAFAGTGISSATLGDGLTEIDRSAFEKCTALRRVALPANLVRIGNDAFGGCSALETVAPFLPAGVATLGSGVFSGCSALEGDLVLDGGGAAVSIGEGAFQYCPGLASADLGAASIASIPRFVFRDDKALSRVVFGATKPSMHADTFIGCTGYQMLWVVPGESETWDAFVATPASATAWGDLTAAQRSAYAAAHPTEPPARALTVASPANQWIVSYAPSAAGSSDLVVAGHPSTYGASGVSPAYGTYANVAAQLPMSLSAPVYAREPTTKWRCAGYRIEEATDAGFANATDHALADPDAPAATYADATPGLRRFSWLWEPVGYKVSVSLPDDSSLGRVTFAGDGADGYFATGAVATVTAVGGSGSPFVRWHGDVPAGHETDATIQLVMDGPKSLVPEFASLWVLAPDGKTVSDGFWTLNVSGTRDALVVGKPVTNYEFGLLDLAKGISGGGAFVQIGGSAFYDNASLRELRLPATLGTIGSRAFYQCRGLETVTPLLPASVTNVQGQAFDGDSYVIPLSGDLTLGTAGRAVTLGGTHHFRNCRIRSVVLGPGVTSVPNSMFEGNSALGDVRAHDGIASIGEKAFFRCSSLTNFFPLLPASLASLGSQAFDNDGNATPLATPLFVGTNGTPVSISGTHHFRNCRIPTAVVGPGVTALPASFFHSIPVLRRVQLHDGIVSIGNEAFRNCTALEEVSPLLPASLATLGNNIFRGASALSGSLTLGTGGIDVALDATGFQFDGTRITNAIVGRRAGSVPPYAFSNNPALADVRLVSMASIGNCAFENDKGIRNLYLGGPLPELHANAFRGWTAGQCLLHVQTGDPSWAAWIDDNVTPWEELSEDLRDAFLDDWPAKRRALGRTVSGANPAQQWVVFWSRFPPPTTLILR